MKIVQPNISYISRRLSLLANQLLLGILLLLFSFSLWLIVTNNDQLGINWKYTLTLVGYIAIGIFYWLTRHKYIGGLINNFFGKKGEDEVSKILQNSLDDSYTYIRNYEIPNKGGDIDGILVGPKGVFIIEVKFYSGHHDIISGEFYKVSKKGRYKMWHNPIRQVLRQKEYLLHLFKNGGLDVHIRPIVVMANGTISIQGSTGVYVLEKERMIEFIEKEPSVRLDTQNINEYLNIILMRNKN